MDGTDRDDRGNRQQYPANEREKSSYLESCLHLKIRLSRSRT